MRRVALLLAALLAPAPAVAQNTAVVPAPFQPQRHEIRAGAVMPTFLAMLAGR